MQSAVFKATLWLLTEVFLTTLGLDDLADYGEYIFKVKTSLPSQQAALAHYECYDGVCTLRNANDSFV